MLCSRLKWQDFAWNFISRCTTGSFSNLVKTMGFTGNIRWVEGKHCEPNQHGCWCSTVFLNCSTWWGGLNFSSLKNPLDWMTKSSILDAPLETFAGSKGGVLSQVVVAADALPCSSTVPPGKNISFVLIILLLLSQILIFTWFWPEMCFWWDLRGTEEDELSDQECSSRYNANCWSPCRLIIHVLTLKTCFSQTCLFLLFSIQIISSFLFASPQATGRRDFENHNCACLVSLFTLF